MTKFQWFLILLVSYCLAMANWAFPAIRTTSMMANKAIMLVVFFSPIVLAILLPDVKRGLKILFYILIVPIALCSFPLGLLSLWPSDALLKSYQLRKSQISVYRTDYGAVADSVIEVRHEKQLVPGLMLVRRIFLDYGEEAEIFFGDNGELYPGEGPEVNRLENSKIEVVSSQNRQAATVLRPWVYF